MAWQQNVNPLVEIKTLSRKDTTEIQKLHIINTGDVYICGK